MTIANPPRVARDRTPALLAGAAVLWLILVSAGFGLLLQYGDTPARTPLEPPERWPAETHVARAASLPTLVQFVHPRCSCSGASLAELERLMTRLAGRAEARVVIVRPRGDEADFDVAALEERVRRIPATVPTTDADGGDSIAFGTSASGTTLLYGSDGRLLFAGGITSSRGQEGPSLGQERIFALASGGHADRVDSPVFGCSLHGY
jgi:hypothetical protein